MTETINLDDVRLDGGTQMRESMDSAAVVDYTEVLESGGSLPPVVVFRDEGGALWLGDGFHRVRAHRVIGRAEVEADVQVGTRRDAALYAAGANTRHGLRPTNADKRRAVSALLADEEWSRWSDREIARRTGTSAPFVGKLREELSVNVYRGERVVSRGGTTYTMNTGASGCDQQGLNPRTYLLDRITHPMREGYWVDPFKGRISWEIECAGDSVALLPAVRGAWNTSVGLVLTSDDDKWQGVISGLSPTMRRTYLEALEAAEAACMDPVWVQDGNLNIRRVVLAIALTSLQWTERQYPHRLRYLPHPEIGERLKSLHPDAVVHVSAAWMPATPGELEVWPAEP